MVVITNSVIIKIVCGADLKKARLAANWSQSKTAHGLGITQAYLSMLENGERRVPECLAGKVIRKLPLSPTARPLGSPSTHELNEEFFKRCLGELGYPGFAYLTTPIALNPAQLLFLALDSEDLDARVTEALPWLPFHFSEMSWDWLIAESKLKNRQNRLAYVTELARIVAQANNQDLRAETLNIQIGKLESSRLANEDTLCDASLSQAERRWLREHRPAIAAHWNLLTDLKVEHLDHIT